MNPPRARRARSARGFSLVELLLAIFILGIGVISVAAVFPAGIALQRQTNDDTLGPMVAQHAMGVLRSRLRQEDFGSFWQFNRGAWPYTVKAFGAPIDIFTIPGDWPWMRPGFLFDDPATEDDEGAIDIFALVKTRQDAGLQPLPGTEDLVSLDKASELPFGFPWVGAPLRGIPYNRSRYQVLPPEEEGSFLRPLPEPLVLISQRERSWPMGSQFGTVKPDPLPQYHWEVMFRRFQGRIWVAVFVYRVGFPSGQPRPYSVAPADPLLSSFDCPSAANRSPLPVLLQTPFANSNRWVAGAVDGDPSAIPATTPGSPLDLSRPRQMWQVPGQWILDQNNLVHRVLNGRRNVSEGPVRFARPIPAVPPAVVYGGAAPPNGEGSPTGPPILTDFLLDSEGVATAWYLPIRDARGAVLTPVYILVEEL